MAEKTCVACAETIKEAAQLCRFCGTRQDSLEEVPKTTPLPGASAHESDDSVGKSRRKPVVMSIVAASILIATSAVGAIAWQATTNQLPNDVSAAQGEEPTPSTQSPSQPITPPRPQQPEPEPEPPPPPPKSPQEILAEEHAAEMKRVCDIVVFYDWNRMDASWGNRGHWKDVARAYDDLNGQIGRVVSFFDFSMQYDRTMGALLTYAQIAEMYEEIDVYSSWEVAGPANRFNDQLNVLWRMCGY